MAAHAFDRGWAYGLSRHDVLVVIFGAVFEECIVDFARAGYAVGAGVQSAGGGEADT